jgi:uroporphyrin-III C-methyltransferase
MNTETDFFISGEVALIGAGPGDPELLTLKAIKYLKHAQVILVDDLVRPEVLEYANSSARIIHVGKRGGCVSTPQAFIEKMLIKEAQAGHRVVRLKGGDPLIFGRGGEELTSLRAAGIKTTIINGVSSGFSAANALGVSLTHRHNSQGVTFITGHLKAPDQQPNWKALVECRTTLVVYMGLSRAAVIREQLIIAGMSPATPVGLVESSSTDQQRCVITDLQHLPLTIDQQQLHSPVIMIIGDVVAAAQQLQRMDFAA